MKKTMKILILIIFIHLSIISLFAYDTSADTSDYNDNYQTLSFTEYGSGSAVVGKPHSIKLPIEAYYNPSMPYTFKLLNESNQIIAPETSYTTQVYNIEQDNKSEIFSLYVLGNDIYSGVYHINIEYEPYFHSAENPSKISNIPISYVVDEIIEADSFYYPRYFFQLSSVINDISKFNSSFNQYSYSLYVRRGPRNLNLLNFHFAWPLIEDIELPSGFFSNELLKSQVFVNIIT